MAATLADPAYVEAVEGAGVPSVFIDPGDGGAGDGIGPGHHRNGPPLPRSADRFLIGGRGRAAAGRPADKKQASPENV